MRIPSFIAFDSSQTSHLPGHQQQLNQDPLAPPVPPTQHLQESQWGIFLLHFWGAEEAVCSGNWIPFVIANSCASIMERPRTGEGQENHQFPSLPCSTCPTLWVEVCMWGRLAPGRTLWTHRTFSLPSLSIIIIFVFFCPLPQQWKFPGQGSNLCHNSGNARSLTCWATRELCYYFPIRRGRRKTNKQTSQGVPAVAQQGGWCLCSARIWVRSPASHSGLKDPALPQLWCGSQLRLASEPWPRNSICQKKKKTNKTNSQEGCGCVYFLESRGWGWGWGWGVIHQKCF